LLAWQAVVFGEESPSVSKLFAELIIDHAGAYSELLTYNGEFAVDPFFGVQFQVTFYEVLQITVSRWHFATGDFPGGLLIDADEVSREAWKCSPLFYSLSSME